MTPAIPSIVPPKNNQWSPMWASAPCRSLFGSHGKIADMQQWV
jgi:hypothetical protein